MVVFPSAHGGNYDFVYENRTLTWHRLQASGVLVTEQGLFDCSRAGAVKETEVRGFMES